MEKIGYVYDWVYVDERFVDRSVLRDLEIEYLDHDDNGQDVPSTLQLYDHIDNHYAIPRYCKFGMQLMYDDAVECGMCEGDDISIQLKVPPRNAFQEDAINAMIANTHGIVCAKTAFGKTYVAISAIARLHKRALILMHKRDLMQQWKDDILRYTDLTEDDVQVFTGADFKRGKAITITTVQNIGAKIRLGNLEVRDEMFADNFGITIYDECHTTMGPRANTMTSRWAFGRRIYGLSATPKRGDPFDKVIAYTFGDVIYNDERKMLPVYVGFVPFNVPIPQKTLYYFKRSEKQYTLRYNKWLVNNDVYIQKAVDCILALILKYNKRILVAAALKVLLERVYGEVYSRLGDLHEDVNRIRLVHGTSKSTFDSLKSMTDEEVEHFNAVFTTNKFFSDGLSINWLDTIVYLTPPSASSLSAIPQLVGRIVREYKGKEYVMVVDLYNDCFEIETLRKRKRCNTYSTLEYNVFDHDFESVDGFVAAINNTRNLSVL